MIEWVVAIFQFRDVLSPVVLGFLLFSTVYSCFYPFGGVALLLGLVCMSYNTRPGQFVLSIIYGFSGSLSLSL